MKKLLFLLLASFPSWAAATLVMTACQLSSDGLTITCTIGGTGFTSPLSPGSGITGFQIGDTQNGSGRIVAATTVTSSGSVVTFSGLKNPATSAPEPLNGPWDDAIAIDLATVGGGANLTDAAGNTPLGQVAFTLGTNNSTWYAAGGSTLAAASRIQGGFVAINTYPQEAHWASSDGYLEVTMTCSAIDVDSFLFNSRYVLIQDGADIHDWGASSGSTIYQPLGLVSGLSGSHTYRFMQIESSLVPYAAQAIRSIRCVGAALGTHPALRTITAECDASITSYAGTVPMTDSRQGHAFLQAGVYNFVDQHVGQAGATVSGGGGLATVCPTEMANVGGTPAVLYLWGNINDLAAMVPTMTYQAAFQSMITGIQGNGSPPNKIVTIGSYLVTGYSVTAYNAALATVATNTGTIYADPSLWLTAGAGKQADNLHLSYGACPDFTLGECVIANRMLPITAGQVLGSSFTFTGPSTGTVGSPSSNFTVTLQGGAQFVLDTDSVGRQTVTCADGGQGGTFTPSVGSPGTGTANITQTTGTNFTFTYNAASSGAKTITCSPAVTSATAGWVAPAPLTFTASGGVANFGQSLSISTGTVSNPSVPAQNTCRLDFMIYDGTISTGGEQMGLFPLCDVSITFIRYPDPPATPGCAMAPCMALQIYNLSYNRGAGSVPLECAGVSAYLQEMWSLPVVSGHQGGYFRYQDTFATRTDSAEVWDLNGNYLGWPAHQGQCVWASYSGHTRSNGITLGGTAGGTEQLGFFRVYPTVLPLNSKIPTFGASNSGPVANYRFDTATGNLADSSGNAYTLTSAGGTDTFPDTPTALQSVVKAVAKTSPAPSWNNWYSLKVGATNTIDASQSFTMDNTSDAVNVTWSHTSGPTTPAYSSFSAAQPTFTNLAFGTYVEHLSVVDTHSVAATTDLKVGAVSYNASGVVQTGNATIDGIFGPMMAFGENPWHWKENRAWASIQGQSTFIPSYLALFNTWQTPATGTASYPFSGTGPVPGTGGTTLTSTCNASATTCQIADAAQLPGLASLPTWLLIGGSATYGNQTEMVRVTATTATSGPATITFAYDGRGLPGILALTGSLPSLMGASTWGSGTAVGEYLISGTSTLFITDSARPQCPAGSPGPPGAVVYSTGTVTLTAGQNTVTGSGTTFTPAILGFDPGTGVFRNAVRISATHGGGTPFATWAAITGFIDATHFTTNHTWPAGVDASAFTYAIVSPRYISLEFTAPNGSIQRALQSSQGCESETKAFAIGAHDIPALNGMTFSGRTVSYEDNLGINSQYGANFYGFGPAERAFCYYSGYCQDGGNGPLEIADALDDNNAGSPENCGGYCGGTPLYFGGGAYGSSVKAVISPGTWATPLGVGGWVADAAGFAAAACDAYDSRDGSILAVPNGIMANHDPDGTRRAAAQAVMATVLTKEQGCSRANFSFANNSEYFNVVGGPTYTLTLGSPTGTITSGTVPAGSCYGVATVNVTALNGSGAFTGTGLVNGDQILINGTINGGTSKYSGVFAFTQSGGTTGTLAALWPGDSGTFSAVIESGTQTPTAFYHSATDPMAAEGWACTQLNSTQITLNRPWDGPTRSDYLNAQAVNRPDPGFHQQPFMVLGWKADEFRLGASIAGATGTGFQALQAGVGTWGLNVGYDPNTLGFNYIREFGLYSANPNGAVTGGCEPSTIQSSNNVISRTPSCDQGVPLAGTHDGAVQGARVLSAEAGLALMEAYALNPTVPLRNAIDTIYGALWGNCLMTDPSYYCDSEYPTGETSDVSLGSYKWTGFFFGHNFGQWPAVRGGGTPVSNGRSVQYQGAVSLRGGVH